MRKPNYYHRILSTLNKLQNTHPEYTLGKHLSVIVDEYNDLWGLPDKDFAYALNKYVKTLEIDKHHESKDELERIIYEGTHLDRLMLDDEDDNDNY